MSDIASVLLQESWAFATAMSSPEVEKTLIELDPLFQRDKQQYTDLVPLDRHQAKPNSLSSITGKGAQPMHTDAAYMACPPRYIAFHCLNRGEAPCPTHLWVVDKERLMQDRPNTLTSCDWSFRGGNQSRFYSPIMDVMKPSLRIRFDPSCMTPINRAHSSKDRVSTILAGYTRHIEIEWITGSLLIFDNWSCLHARGDGAVDAPSRVLRRWYIGANYGLGT